MRYAIRLTLAVLALFCMLLLCTTRSVLAQNTNSGDIRGTVQDASGAVVPGVTVTLTNIDTGESKVFVTNDNGIYDTVSTRPGNYNLRFSKEGFKQVTRGPIQLQVSVITEDATLEVGQTTEVMHVEVSGPPLLQTESGEQGTILQGKTIDELPQIGAGITGNDWANFAILLPGAAGAPCQPQSEGSGSYNAGDAVSVNGNLPMYTNILADGATVILPVSGNVDNSIFESIAEVQISTSSFSAQYGIGGAVFNQISKSGSNTFHGSLYEYWQNDALNASNFFLSPQGTPTKNVLRYNEWGGSVGGPIIKNKLFFFFVRDKIENKGSNSPQLSTVPTLAERGMGTANPGAYDFSGTPTIYNPASAGVGGTRTAFAGNIIPANMIDPVALKALSFYPLPNAPGTAVAGFPGQIQDNFSFTPPSSNPNLRYFGRLDYDLSSNNRLTFSITAKNNPGQNFGSLPCPLSCFSGDIDGYNVQASDTWTITPTMVNEFRMGYTKQGNWFVPQSIGYNAETSLGLQYAKADLIPTFNLNGICCAQISPGTNAIYIENLYDPSDMMTLIRGRHILHFGVEVLMGQGNTTPWGNVDAGTFTFTGQYTQQNCPAGSTTCVPGGSSFADFLLGDVQRWQATNQAVTYMRIKSPQLFVQDDFKAKPNLTINLGLRYVATTGMTELHNAYGGFNPNIVNPYNGALGSMTFGGQNNISSLQKPIYNIFLPRVGFSWSPGFFRNTTLRGGFGMYSYNFSEDTYGGGLLGAGALGTNAGSATDPNGGTGPAPLINLDASAATAGPILNYVMGSPAARQPLTYITPANPQNVVYMPYNVPVGRINEWSLSVEHQFASNLVASVAYVGSHGSNLQFPTDLNQITDPAVLAAGPTTQAQRPYPLFGNIIGDYYNGISNYNSLQTSVTKRYSSGLTFQVNYVWSHFLDDQDSGGWGQRGGFQFWQVGNDPKANYANSNFDIPQAVKGIASYELPFGRGKTYLSGANYAEDVLVGGWRVSGTFIAQSGNPFTVYGSTVNNYSQCSIANNTNGGCVSYLNQVANVYPTPALPAGAQGISYFNGAAFVSPPAGTFGTIGRNTLRGPRLTVINLSLAKSFRFRERFGLELRADFVNALNHPSFQPPNSNIDGANFGSITPSEQAGGTTVAPRSGQLSARFSF